MKTPIDEPITMFKKQFNFLSMAVHPFPNFPKGKVLDLDVIVGDSGCFEDLTGVGFRPGASSPNSDAFAHAKRLLPQTETAESRKV